MDLTRSHYEVTEVRQGRKQGIFVVCLDNETALLCPDDVLARWRLRKGSVLTADMVKELAAEAEGTLARRAALEVLARGPLSAKQLETNLKRHGFGPVARQAAISRMRELGYIDDAAYARSLANSLNRAGRLGSIRIRSELIKRGVERELVEDALDASDPTLEREKALALLRKRWREEYRSDQAAIRRLSAYLQRRGFDWPTIRWSLEQVLPEVDIDSSEG